MNDTSSSLIQLRKLIQSLQKQESEQIQQLHGDVEDADADAALVRKDYLTAFSKYKSAAAKNNAYSQYNLGVMYNNGRGVKQDYAEAVRWYKLAAAQG